MGGGLQAPPTIDQGDSGSSASPSIDGLIGNTGSSEALSFPVPFTFPPLTCDLDCTCDYLDYLDGAYIIPGFFSALPSGSTWCFPDQYPVNECINVSCAANGTACSFGPVTMTRMDLAGPNETDLEIKIRMEGDFYNFSLGLVSTGASFTANSLTVNTDGTPVVSGLVTNMEADTIPLAMSNKRCAEATLAPTPSPTPSPTP